MKTVSDPKKIDKVDRIEKVYDIFGQQGNNFICAKEVYFTDTKRTKYYVLYADSQLFNPRNLYDSRYLKRHKWKMISVRQSVFDTYVRFLTTKHEIFLKQAEREV